MFKTDFWEYVKILLRTKSSYRIILDELNNDQETINAEQKQRIRSQILVCDQDICRLIEELKKRGELKY